MYASISALSKSAAACGLGDSVWTVRTRLSLGSVTLTDPEATPTASFHEIDLIGSASPSHSRMVARGDDTCGIGVTVCELITFEAALALTGALRNNSACVTSVTSSPPTNVLKGSWTFWI